MARAEASRFNRMLVAQAVTDGTMSLGRARQ